MLKPQEIITTKPFGDEFFRHVPGAAEVARHIVEMQKILSPEKWVLFKIKDYRENSLHKAVNNDILVIEKMVFEGYLRRKYEEKYEIMPRFFEELEKIKNQQK